MQTGPKLEQMEQQLAEHRSDMHDSDEERAIRTGNPLASLLDNDTGVVWAKAEVLADSPDKAGVEGGDEIGALFRRRLLRAAARGDGCRLVVAPYVIHGGEGEGLLKERRARVGLVRVLTNSRLSVDVLAVHAGYRRFRVPLLEAGVQLYEVKPLPGKPHPRGGLLKTPSSGQFSLHAKAYVFDRNRIFIGSANFDRRSLHLNTEIGLMIDSPELAQQVITRFDTIANPANSFVLALEDDGNGSHHIVWKSVKDGKPIVYETEPGDDRWRELEVDLYGLLPLDDEL